MSIPAPIPPDPTASPGGTDAPGTRWSRLRGPWGLTIAVVLVAMALVVTAWSSRRSVQASAASVTDGQASRLAQTVRADLVELGRVPTADDLRTILDDHHADGVRYLALSLRGGERLEAGTPSRHQHRLELRPGRPRRREPPWPQLVVEIAPTEAAALTAAADRSLLVGVIAALVLVAVGALLVRAALAQQRALAARERLRNLANLGQMSAVLSHEIRNPLASLKGNAQLLASWLPAGERTRAKADRVVEEATRLEALSNDLLDFVRTGQLRRAEVAPAAVLRDAVAGQDVTIDDAAAPARWSLDPERMRQVLTNLIENALAAGGPVTARVAQEGQACLFSVTDHGPGIAEADLPHLFEPFFTRRTRGTGLGLAVARQIVERHGGVIAARNQPGGGARFTVTLPPASAGAGDEA